MSTGTTEDCDTLPSTWTLDVFGNTFVLINGRIDYLIAGITKRGNFKRWSIPLDDWTPQMRLLKYNRTGKILEIKSYEPPTLAIHRTRKPRRKVKRRA